MTWNRRSVLRALATSAAAPLLVPIFQGCGPSGPQVTGQNNLVAAAPGAIRTTLREVVSELSTRFSHATGLATLRRMGRALVDAEERGVHQDLHTAVVLEVEHQGRRFEQATTKVSPTGIRTAAQLLKDRASAGYNAARPATPMAKPRDFVSPMAIDPRTVPASAWIQRLEASYQLSRSVGGSRIVYRGAYLSVEDRTDIFVGRGRDLSQRLVRTRSGVVLIARRNLGESSVPVVEVAEHSGLLGLEATALSPDALEAAAERVLAMVSPTAYPTGLMPVILAPPVAGLFARECVGRAVDGRRWLLGESRAASFYNQRLASERVTLIDDPSAAGAFGSYYFDDEGQTAEATTVISAGKLVRPLTDRVSAALLDVPRTANGRRLSPLDPVAVHISNLSWMPGQKSREQLLASVDRGLLLDGALLAQVHTGSWRFSLRAARAYEIRAGKQTGVLYSDIDIRGQVPALLQAVEGVSDAAVRALALTTVPATVSSPHVLTRAEVV